MVGENYDARRLGKAGKGWSNWSGLQRCQPRDFVKVSGVGELAEVVGKAGSEGRQVTTVGSGHSFTPTALSDDLLLDITREEAHGRDYVAGAFVGPSDAFDRDGYLRQMEMITARDGIPVIFQSSGLTRQSDDAIVASYAELGRHCDRFVGFELGTVFAPFGKIYSLDVYRGLLGIPQCIGAKHSSLSRDLEWQRLQLRDEVRPDFKVFTGNDLAIDMVMYGSDYLLGLSTMAPDWFGKRDAAWAAGDPAFHQINDVLQYLGFLTFRAPVPAYKHSAAMFLKLRGWIDCDDTHPQSPTRPDSDRAILAEIVKQLDQLS